MEAREVMRIMRQRSEAADTPYEMVPEDEWDLLGVHGPNKAFGFIEPRADGPEIRGWYCPEILARHASLADETGQEDAYVDAVATLMALHVTLWQIPVIERAAAALAHLSELAPQHARLLATVQTAALVDARREPS